MSYAAIDKLGLTAVDHPQPYKICWIDNATHEVTHKYLISIYFNAYKASV